MLRLNFDKEPRWVELMAGVELLVAPLTSSILAASRDMAKAGQEDDAGDEAMSVARWKAAAQLIVRDWRGICGMDDKPLPLTPEALNALLEEPSAYGAFHSHIVIPWLAVDAEKKGSAPSQNGTSAGAPTTARPAGKRAKPARRG